MSSILSREPDGHGFYYGWLPDRRGGQINVRQEGPWWAAYVGGDHVGLFQSKGEAEAHAIKVANEDARE